MSRVAAGLALVAGGGSRAVKSTPSMAGERGLSAHRPTPVEHIKEQRFALPTSSCPTLSELFAVHPRDSGWTAFLLAQLASDKPLLWIQERMAILESGRVHPLGLPMHNLIHVEARDARDALWAMEEGLRCSALCAVIGEIWGNPRALDFTATRRLAVASERSGVSAFLIRLGGEANLSGARMRWRIASASSIANELDPRAPGLPAWNVELFRARGHAPGRWSIAHDATQTGAFHLASAAAGRTLGEERRLSA
ncbi:MAG TPA: recA-like protein [Sphingomicrobium sp.]|nr:recA-like protein [Sphingomicrobium sp.]